MVNYKTTKQPSIFFISTYYVFIDVAFELPLKQIEVLAAIVFVLYATFPSNEQHCTSPALNDGFSYRS